MKWLLVVPLILASAAASAQRIELAPLISLTTPVTLDRTAQGVDQLEINEAVTWGARGSYALTERVELEGLWTYQSTEMLLSSAAGVAALFDMTTHHVFGNVAYQLGGGRVRPFVFGGAGAAFFDAPDLEDEVKPAWDFGGGVKWFVQPSFGIEGRVRYQITNLGETSAETCGPFDFCQGLMRNLDIGTAFVVRF